MDHIEQNITTQIKKIDMRQPTKTSISSPNLGEQPKKLKKIAETDEWTAIFSLESDDHSTINILDSSLDSPFYNYLHKHISIKQQGYKSQDRQKNLFEENKFISVDEIFALLKSSRLFCFYCNLRVKLIYKYARDPKQWSLERIDNSYGHNTDNVVIACLDCNLRRRTIFQERYKKTKEMYHVVKLD